MAQISLEEIYRGENAGQKYDIMGAVFTDMYTNGVPAEYDENTWREMLFVKHTLMAAEQMRKEGDFVSGITDAEPSSSAEVVNADT